MKPQDDINVPMVATVGAVSVLLTTATVFAVQALFLARMDSESQRKVVEAPTVASDTRIAEQEAAITRYGWIDRESGTIAIPIDRAMRLVVEDLNGEDRSDHALPPNAARMP